jgi:hypothetical protein
MLIPLHSLNEQENKGFPIIPQWNYWGCFWDILNKCEGILNVKELDIP